MLKQLSQKPKPHICPMSKLMANINIALKCQLFNHFSYTIIHLIFTTFNEESSFYLYLKGEKNTIQKDKK